MSKPIMITSMFPNPVGHAAQRAAMLAPALNSQAMEILSVIPGDEPEGMAAPAPHDGSRGRHVTLARCMNDVKTASATALIRYGMRCSATFEFGRLYELSLRRASEADPAAIVMGWQAHPWWPTLYNFNLLRDLSRYAMRPMLLVRQEPRRPYAHAVFASDFSDESLQTLKLATRLLPGARITIVHAYNVPGQGHMRAAGVRDDAIDACREQMESEIRRAYARTVDELGTASARLSLALLPRPTGLSVTNYVNAVGADVVILSGCQRWLVDEWCWQARARDLIGKTASDLLMITSARRA
ncbi:hypothetical protein ACFQ09_02085 [Massilia norwichensis]|uniref:Universal stress protein n=1 Tax=Massilia norwichensis TaxID=1442366 RepID=A0ABT2A7T3_9BURK|nr:hypothetical protein [Massilia norwichensis]MCS0590271.1 hypothetical protein [Massilia norwichensis]